MAVIKIEEKYLAFMAIPTIKITLGISHMFIVDNNRKNEIKKAQTVLTVCALEILIMRSTNNRKNIILCHDEVFIPINGNFISSIGRE